MQPGILFSSPDLRPSLMSVVQGMADSGLLQKLVTTIAVDPAGAMWHRLDWLGTRTAKGVRTRLANRTVPPFLAGKVDSIWSRELCRLVASRYLDSITAHRLWLWAELGFDRSVARQYAGRFQVVYGMEHSSLETFRRQKEKGGMCLLRQVTTHGRFSRSIFERELKRFPEFARHYSPVFQDDFARSVARKEAEYQLADAIVANSSFVAETFVQAGIPAEKMRVVATGCPPVAVCESSRELQGSRPLVFLFVGKLTFLKGIPYLLEAWKHLKGTGEAELWLAGDGELAEVISREALAGVKQLGKVNRTELARLYARADVVVLPTLLEGLSHVVLEGIAHGVPVLTTRESGGGDVLVEGETGLFVPAADAKALAEKMRWCLDHAARLPEMGQSAQAVARQRTVEHSNAQHLKILEQLLGNPG